MDAILEVISSRGTPFTVLAESVAIRQVSAENSPSFIFGSNSGHQDNDKLSDLTFGELISDFNYRFDRLAE